MEIYSGPYRLSAGIWMKENGGKRVNAASLDTHKEQCLQNPLIYSTLSYVYIHFAKWQSILTLSLLTLFFCASTNCHLTSEEKAAIIALQ